MNIVMMRKKLELHREQERKRQRKNPQKRADEIEKIMVQAGKEIDETVRAWKQAGLVEFPQETIDKIEEKTKAEIEKKLKRLRSRHPIWCLENKALLEDLR